MPLTGPRDMFAKALAGGFAVGAFNINNMETVQGILQAAGDERCLLYTSPSPRD